jgi:hypothetical protein
MSENSRLSFVLQGSGNASISMGMPTMTITSTNVVAVRYDAFRQTPDFAGMT